MPSRFLKESITASESLDNLTEAEEAFFMRLLVVVDDYGRTDARISMLHSSIYRLTPTRATDEQIGHYLVSLEREGMISLYRVDEKPYLQIINWLKYQLPRSKESRFPPPSANICKHVQTSANICKHVQTSANICKHVQTSAPRATNTNTNNEYEETNTNTNTGAGATPDYCQDAINAWKSIHTPRGSIPECQRAWAAVMKLPKSDRPSEPDLFQACVTYCADCAARDSYTKQFKYFLSPSSRPFEEYLPANYHQGGRFDVSGQATGDVSRVSDVRRGGYRENEIDRRATLVGTPVVFTDEDIGRTNDLSR
jgi:hypothetical protein